MIYENRSQSWILRKFTCKLLSCRSVTDDSNWNWPESSLGKADDRISETSTVSEEKRSVSWLQTQVVGWVTRFVTTEFTLPSTMNNHFLETNQATQCDRLRVFVERKLFSLVSGTHDVSCSIFQDVSKKKLRLVTKKVIHLDRNFFRAINQRQQVLSCLHESSFQKPETN